MKLLIVLALMLAAPAAADAAMQPAAPAEAQRWTHPASGASVPRRFEGLAIGETRDLGNGLDSVVDYAGSGDTADSLTLYIFRPPFPDARLWFDRALSTRRPPATFQPGPDTPFTAFGAAAPNGVYRVYRTDQPGPFRTTSLAVAQAGEWVVKILYSSGTLDAGAMAARIATLTETIRFPDGIVAAPLSAPVADCTRPPVDGTGRPAQINEENVAAATVGGLLLAERIRQPLAGSASSWCRDAGFPAGQGTLLRWLADPHNWTLLLGDAGQAVVAVNGEQMGLPGERRSAVFVAASEFLRLAAVYDGTPPMLPAMQAAAPVLGGRSPGLIQIGPGRGEAPAQPGEKSQ